MVNITEKIKEIEEEMKRTQSMSIQSFHIRSGTDCSKRTRLLVRCSLDARSNDADSEQSTISGC